LKRCEEEFERLAGSGEAFRATANGMAVIVAAVARDAEEEAAIRPLLVDVRLINLADRITAIREDFVSEAGILKGFANHVVKPEVRAFFDDEILVGQVARDIHDDDDILGFASFLNRAKETRTSSSGFSSRHEVSGASSKWGIRFSNEKGRAGSGDMGWGSWIAERQIMCEAGEPAISGKRKRAFFKATASGQGLQCGISRVCLTSVENHVEIHCGTGPASE
jgi:hypothetical protein